MRNRIIIAIVPGFVVDQFERQFPITNMFDDEGEDTDDLQEAVSIVVCYGPNEWVVFEDIDQHVNHTVN